MVLRKLTIKNSKEPIVNQFSDALLAHHVLSDGDDGNWKYKDWKSIGAEAALYSNGRNIRSIGLFFAIYATSNDSNDAEWKQSEWTASTYDRIHEDMYRMYSMRDYVSSMLSTLSDAGMAAQAQKMMIGRIITICTNMVSYASFHDGSFMKPVLKAITHATDLAMGKMVSVETCVRMLDAVNTSVLEQSLCMIDKLDSVFLALSDNEYAMGPHNLSVTGIIALCNEDILDSILTGNGSVLPLSRVPYSQYLRNTGKMADWLGYDGTVDVSWDAIVLKYTACMYELFRTVPSHDEKILSMMMSVINEVDETSAYRLIDDLLVISPTVENMSYQERRLSDFIGKATHLVLASCNGLSITDVAKVTTIASDYDEYIISESNGSCLHLSPECFDRLNVLGVDVFWKSVMSLSMVFSVYTHKQREQYYREIDSIVDPLLEAIHNRAYSNPEEPDNTTKCSWLFDMVTNRASEALGKSVPYAYDDAIQSMASDVRNGDMTIPYGVWLTNYSASHHAGES